MRGSTPAPGVEFSTVGGNTSCVAIPARDGRWLLLDAGTGMARLAGVLDDEPLRASVLLTHLHWDHTHGLPFLPNADNEGAEIDVLLPAPANGATALDDDGPGDVPAALPRRARRVARHVALPIVAARAVGDRGLRGDRGRDPARRRPHVRVPGRRRHRQPGLPARPQPAAGDCRATGDGCGADRGRRRAPARRRVRRRRARRRRRLRPRHDRRCDRPGDRRRGGPVGAHPPRATAHGRRDRRHRRRSRRRSGTRSTSTSAEREHGSMSAAADEFPDPRESLQP